MWGAATPPPGNSLRLEFQVDEARLYSPWLRADSGRQRQPAAPSHEHCGAPGVTNQRARGWGRGRAEPAPGALIGPARKIQLPEYWPERQVCKLRPAGACNPTLLGRPAPHSPLQATPRAARNPWHARTRAENQVELRTQGRPRPLDVCDRGLRLRVGRGTGRVCEAGLREDLGIRLWVLNLRLEAEHGLTPHPSEHPRELAEEKVTRESDQGRS
ncbi:PREDICTED: uncharacterized protein LOC109384858 [Hipposideros armiger]|uniref:Uncharacterized protein LOC109384858 n=1 Tax=Hipposideros armiger TaxID=186990 RepID=A0A8B7RLU2_HIPAR|nr:PREDICTED: uncharacterized protein LOC109384858 [Hipposideros armiger]